MVPGALFLLLPPAWQYSHVGGQLEMGLRDPAGSVFTAFPLPLQMAFGPPKPYSFRIAVLAAGMSHMGI